MNATELIKCLPGQIAMPPLFAPTPEAAWHFVEFFTARISNSNTRKAYRGAVARFAAWCEERQIREIGTIRAFHVAAFVEDLRHDLSAPTVKQHLAALRALFDWLVVAQVIPMNPAHAVRGPKHVVKRGKTPVLRGDEARALLESIETGTITGLRDRALIGVMVYSFARINAVLGMNVQDYFIQSRRSYIRLREKGGKEHEVPCHHNLEEYLDDYIEAAGIGGLGGEVLFRTAAGRSGRLTSNRMWQQDAYRMIQRRAKAAGIETRVGNHTFRATGITAYLKNGGQLETAQQIAGHESPRTTKLYDRRRDEISLDEIERIFL